MLPLVERMAFDVVRRDVWLNKARAAGEARRMAERIGGVILTVWEGALIGWLSDFSAV